MSKKQKILIAGAALFSYPVPHLKLYMTSISPVPIFARQRLTVL